MGARPTRCGLLLQALGLIFIKMTKDGALRFWESVGCEDFSAACDEIIPTHDRHGVGRLWRQQVAGSL